MREIIFRGKRKDNSKWVLGGFHSHNGKAYIIGISKQEKIDGIEVIPETVGQYTGLTDKNGTKIFENDICIVTRPCISVRGKIIFFKGCFIFNEFIFENFFELDRLTINQFEIEVIGNIHNNPELLGGEIE